MAMNVVELADCIITGLMIAAERNEFRALTLNELREIHRALFVCESVSRQHERLALCPDHRDKTTGRCVVCDAESRTRIECKGRHEG